MGFLDYLHIGFRYRLIRMFDAIIVRFTYHLFRPLGHYAIIVVCSAYRITIVT